MVRDRIIGGVLFGIPVLAAVWVGGIWIVLVFFFLIGAAVTEFVQIAARRGHRAFGGLMLSWTALFMLDRIAPQLGMLQPGVAILMLITLGWALIRYRQGTPDAFIGFTITLGGSLYIGWGGSHLLGLRFFEDGLYWLLTVLLSIWGTDTFAYIVGRTIGRTKLMPDVSPGKTWEGYLGGLILTPPVVAAAALGWQALGAGANVTPLNGLIIALLVATISPLGDLGISILKRSARVKDSGHLIPGHGGALDRLDATLIAGLIGYYYLTLFVL